MEDQGDQRALADALDRFSRKADEILRQGNTNTAKIEVNAGGVGVAIAACACVAMMVALMILVPVAVGAYSEQQDQIRRLDDSDNAIRAYINTGILKPKQEKSENAD